MKMIEPEHIDEMVRLTKSAALTWRKTLQGVTEAVDVVYLYHLLPDGATLIRVGLNPFALECGGMSRTTDLPVRGSWRLWFGAWHCRRWRLLNDCHGVGKELGHHVRPSST